MYRSGRINRQPVAEFIKGETNASVNIPIKTKDYLLARGMTAYPTGIAFDIGLPEHLAQVIGYSQKKGITGAHNAIIFNDAVNKYNLKVISQTKGATNGIEHIQYQIPSKDREGNITGYKNEIFMKTVYNPIVFSDQKILDLGLQAAAIGYETAISSGKREFVATSNGVKFQVYLDINTGIVLNFFPVN